MESRGYQVVTEGLIVPGYDQRAVKRKFAQLLNLQNQPERLEQLFSGRRVILKKGVTETQAKEFAMKVQSYGLKCMLVGEAANSEVATPSPVRAITEILAQQQAQPQKTQSKANLDPQPEFQPKPVPPQETMPEVLEDVQPLGDVSLDPSNTVFPKVRYGFMVGVLITLGLIGGGAYWGSNNPDKVFSAFEAAHQFYDETINSLFGEDGENIDVPGDEDELASVDEESQAVDEQQDLVQEEENSEAQIASTAQTAKSASTNQNTAKVKSSPNGAASTESAEALLAAKKAQEEAQKKQAEAAVAAAAAAAKQVESETERVERLLGKNKKVKEEPFFPDMQDSLRDGDLGPVMVVIPAGSFVMGDVLGGGDETELPLREVNIVRPFAMSMYEVTFAEYDIFANVTGRELPKDQLRGRGDRPVINVSWDDAKAYAEWLSQQTGKTYRLPSEAEWEYVARAGKQTRYTWGNELGTNKANCKGCGSVWDNIQLSPVGKFPANAYGIHDLHGNAWEWVEDCFHETYGAAPIDGSAWIENGECRMRGLRGGSWRGTEETIRTAKRRWNHSFSRNDMVGFRLVRDLGN